MEKSLELNALVLLLNKIFNRIRNSLRDREKPEREEEYKIKS